MTRLDRFNRTMAAIAATAALSMSASATASGNKNLVESAVRAEKFNVFLRAARKAGLDEVLKTQGPFTVFAPTDQAFAKLPENELRALLGDRERLTALLTHHVVPGNVAAANMPAMTAANTLHGDEVRFDTRNGVTVDEAHIVDADVKATNGVIHAVDTVLLPK